jgi:multidrug resistance efflux pump
VKIAVDPNDPLRGDLRPGMSVTATVDTRTSADGSGMADARAPALETGAVRRAALH